MGSIRKISLLAAVAAVAIAVAAPAAASAANRLEYPNGEKVPMGATLSLTSSNMKIQGPGGQWSYCATATMPGEVIKNTEASAEVEGAGPGTTEWCTFRGISRPIQVELTMAKFTSSKAGTMALKLSQDWGEGYICKREGTLPMTYVPGTSVVSVKGSFPGSWCLTEYAFSGDFSLKAGYPFPGEPIVIK